MRSERIADDEVNGEGDYDDRVDHGDDDDVEDCGVGDHHYSYRVGFCARVHVMRAWFGTVVIVNYAVLLLLMICLWLLMFYMFLLNNCMITCVYVFLFFYYDLMISMCFHILLMFVYDLFVFL